MEVKTIVLDGIEYVLIPRDLFEKKEEVVPETPPADDLSDFEPEESVKITDSISGIKKAQGNEYGYKKRLEQHKLQPEDVMVLKTNFEEMPETQEIARNDFKHRIPPGKWGFYGPGAERDLG